jgi:hypothetical protein
MIGTENMALNFQKEASGIIRTSESMLTILLVGTQNATPTSTISKEESQPQV